MTFINIPYCPADAWWPCDTEQAEEEETEPHPKAKKIKLPDGSSAMACISCEEHCKWAEPNQDDGTFKCYSCRNL